MSLEVINKETNQGCRGHKTRPQTGHDLGAPLCGGAYQQNLGALLCCVAYQDLGAPVCGVDYQQDLGASLAM